ncbi:MAG: ArsR/SmtB family transcription factor [Solirubrobacterales bacterium]
MPRHGGRRAREPTVSGEPSGCEQALAHPLRQALFTLLRHRPATAPELQAVVRRPLQTVAYHLGVLVECHCLLAETKEEKIRYRLDPRAAHMLPGLGGPEVGPDHVVMMSLLDAAWAAIGRSPERASLAPSWEVHRLDEDGLFQASAIVAQALEQIRAIARLSHERNAARPQDGPMHMLVAVASLIESPSDEPGGASR